MIDTDTAARVARTAVADAGVYLRGRFDRGAIDADHGPGDVTTAADHEAERRVLDRIRETYPDHAITAEESGHHEGAGPYRWVVDALDGTNNFAAGVPTFGVAVTLLDDEGPLVTAVDVPVSGDRYLARRGGGVTWNGEPTSAADGPDLPPSHATVASVIGAPVIRDGSLRAKHRDRVEAIRDACKRVVETWAPVVYWGLLARGRIGGYVTVQPDEREQVAGDLLAREAGCHRRDDGPVSVFARDETTLAALRAAL